MNELTKVLVLCDENPPVFECQLHHIVAGSAKRLYHREVAALVHDEANHVTLAASPLPEE